MIEAPFEWEFGATLMMSLTVDGDLITGAIDGVTVLQTNDAKLDAGAIGLIVEEGRTATSRIQVGRAS